MDKSMLDRWYGRKSPLEKARDFIISLIERFLDWPYRKNRLMKRMRELWLAPGIVWRKPITIQEMRESGVYKESAIDKLEGKDG